MKNVKYAFLTWIIFALFMCSISAQNNIKKTAAVNYTQGIPTILVAEKTGSEIAIDTATGYIYQWHRTAGPSELGGWRVLGQGIDVRVDNMPPTYTPFRNQSWFVINGLDSLYHYTGTGTVWRHINKVGSGGGGGTVTTDATLSGDGSGGTPLKIAQQSAATSEMLTWTGATWEPSWGNPYTFVTSGATITTAINTVLVGTIVANITIGLPTCNASNDQKTFEIKKNGADIFGAIIDPAGSETFYDGAATKTIYSPISLNCTCRFSGTGVWFYTN